MEQLSQNKKDANCQNEGDKSENGIKKFLGEGGSGKIRKEFIDCQSAANFFSHEKIGTTRIKNTTFYPKLGILDRSEEAKVKWKI